MNRKKQNLCRMNHCNKEPHSLGLCKEHYEQYIRDKNLQEEAIEALHKAHIDGALPTNPAIREQLFEIRKWWLKACDALNHNRTDDVLCDETEYALDWCISLAKEIIAAERALNSGQQPSHLLEQTSKQVYQKFSNLEKGLMSNSLARSAR
jgi:hypothetical protein